MPRAPALLLPYGPAGSRVVAARHDRDQAGFRRLLRPLSALSRWTAASALALACGGPDEPPRPEPLVEPPPPAESPALRRLAQEQYRNAVTDLLGDGLILPTSLEPDTSVDGLLAIGAALTSISPLGVEQYEDAAYDLAEQVMADAARRGDLAGCQPSGTQDRACAEQFVRTVGRRAWRRPLTDAEVAVLADLAELAALELDDFWMGLGYALAGLLQSPHFLYRQELGADGRYTSFELASRMSFLLWSSIPDEALLDAAEAGELDTVEEIEAQARRMLDDPKAKRGVRAFASEWLELYELDAMTKEPSVFPHFTDATGPSAREETLLLVEDLVFAQDADFRDLLTTYDTFVDTNLSMIYGVPAPQREGFGRITLDPAGGRRGFLGQVSFLALQSHAVSTSATLRGKFVREALLCMEIPPPPANLNTAIPEPSEDALTLRDRVAIHLENEYCAGCHVMMDPIGLGLETFDGIGLWRTTEHGVTIDPSGDLDGIPFADADDLAVTVGTHPDLGPCISETLWSWSIGHRPTEAERATNTWLYQRFAEDDHSLRELLVTLITSEAFRAVGEVE